MAEGYLLDEKAIRAIARALIKLKGFPDFLPLNVRELRQGQNDIWLAKANEDIAKGTEGSVTLYARGNSMESDYADKGDEAALSGEQNEYTFDAYARLGSVTSGTWCYVSYIDGGWEIINAEC